MLFKSLSPGELDKHRGTCPLEIGRFRVISNKVEELIGPLEIYLIFTDINDGQNIQVSPIQLKKPQLRNVDVFEGNDGRIYTQERDGVRYSITKILGTNG